MHCNLHWNMKDLLKLAFCKSAFPLSAILAVTLTTGCCSVVAKSGDAKIVKCWEPIHSKGMETFHMKFPTTNLSPNDTNILRVRNLPGYIEGRILYFFSMQVPYSDITSNSVASWEKAKVTLTFKRLDGSEFYKQTLPLGAKFRHFRRDQYGRPTVEGTGSTDDGEGLNFEWGLGSLNDIAVSDTSYDIVIVFDYPSLMRRSFQISLVGYATRRKQ
jgi:hypothetical protein